MSNNKRTKVFKNDKELIIEKLLDSTSLKYEELVATAKIAETFNIDLIQTIALIKFIKLQYNFEPNYNWFIWKIYEAEEVGKVERMFIKETNKLVKAYTNEQQA